MINSEYDEVSPTCGGVFFTIKGRKAWKILIAELSLFTPLINTIFVVKSRLMTMLLFGWRSK